MNHDPVSYPDLYRNFAHPNQSRPGPLEPLGKDLTYFTGGRQTIGGDRLSDVQKNLKIGGTLVVPFRVRYAIKFGYANGAVTRRGNDFNQFLLSYQVLLK